MWHAALQTQNGKSRIVDIIISLFPDTSVSSKSSSLSSPASSNSERSILSSASTLAPPREWSNSEHLMACSSISLSPKRTVSWICTKTIRKVRSLSKKWGSYPKWAYNTHWHLNRLPPSCTVMLKVRWEHASLLFAFIWRVSYSLPCSISNIR